MMPLNLTGQRLQLRPLHNSDLETILTAYRDLDLQLITDGDSPPLTDVQVQTCPPGRNHQYPRRELALLRH